VKSRPSRSSGPRPGPRGTDRTADTEIVFGLRAALAVGERRPADVLRVGFARELGAEVSPLGRLCADRGLPFVTLAAPDLQRIAGSAHHEGICVECRPRRWTSTSELASLLVERRGLAVALDRVRNPYNVGAILRTAAFLGIDAALFGAIAPQPALAPDAVRVAEGGAEHLALCRSTDLADTLGRLHERGVAIVGADGASRTSAIGFDFRRPSVLVVGHEREGLAPRTRARCDAVVAIPGKGAIESLNVAVAASFLLLEAVRSTGSR